MNKYFHCDSITLSGQKELNVREESGPWSHWSSMYWKLHTTAKCITWCATVDGGTARKTDAQWCTIPITASRRTIWWFVQQILASFRFHFQFSLSRLLLATFHFDFSLRLSPLDSRRLSRDEPKLSRCPHLISEALVKPKHVSHLGTVWKCVVMDQYTIGLVCSQGTQTVEINISTLGWKGNQWPTSMQWKVQPSILFNGIQSMVNPCSIHLKNFLQVTEVMLILVAHAAKQHPIEEYLVQRVPGSQVGFPEPQPCKFSASYDLSSTFCWIPES